MDKKSKKDGAKAVAAAYESQKVLAVSQSAYSLVRSQSPAEAIERYNHGKQKMRK